MLRSTTSSSRSHSAEGGDTIGLSTTTLAFDWAAARQTTDVLGYGQMEMHPDPDTATAASAGDISSIALPSSSYATSSLGVADNNPRPKRRRKGPQKLPGKTSTNKERHFVQHNYHDLLNEPDSMSSENESSRLSDDSFPMILHRMLDEVEKEGFAHVISWQPHGRAFIIRDASLFSRIIMPKYFPKSKKITSIQRQFNIYGFEKLTRDGPDQGAYYHEAFLRGRPELTSRRMVRKRVKGTGHKACSNPDVEPDFYSSMPFVTVEGSSSKSANETHSQAFTAPTLDEILSSLTIEESDQGGEVQPLFSSSQQMFQGYSTPSSQVQAHEQTRSAAQEIDDAPIDLFHFDWGDGEIW